jgi:outer membrane murein-binding lipoprotein Lpp
VHGALKEDHLMNVLRSTAILTVLGMPLLLGGCASKDDLQKVQGTADQALSSAHDAQQTANSARSAAQDAQQTANQNSAKIDALTQQVQGLQNQQTSSKGRHRGERG